MPDWRHEFGTLFDVPDYITKELVDVSYGNDDSPSFIARNQKDSEEASGEIILPRLWVGHPDPERRSRPAPRFQIQYNNETIWQGGSVLDAVMILKIVTKTLDLHVDFAGCN